jgi:biotin carboxyl carrier protein
VEFRYAEDDPIQVERAGDGYQVSIGGRVYEVRLLDAQVGEVTLLINGRRVHAFVGAEGSQRWVALGGVVYTLRRAENVSRKRATLSGDHNLTATMPGQVIRLLVVEGEVVQRGQALLVLEAMKMEVRISAPHVGTVKRVLCHVGQIVERGQPLLELAAASD